MASFGNVYFTREQNTQRTKTALVPLLPIDVKSGALCCVCLCSLEEACKMCFDNVFKEGGKPCCPLVVTQACRHAYHRHCIDSWLLYEPSCVGSRPGLSKYEDEEAFLECGIEIDE